MPTFTGEHTVLPFTLGHVALAKTRPRAQYADGAVGDWFAFGQNLIGLGADELNAVAVRLEVVDHVHLRDAQNI